MLRSAGTPETLAEVAQHPTCSGPSASVEVKPECRKGLASCGGLTRGESEIEPASRSGDAQATGPKTGHGGRVRGQAKRSVGGGGREKMRKNPARLGQFQEEGIKSESARQRQPRIPLGARWMPFRTTQGPCRRPRRSNEDHAV